ncbi:phage/plasmid primase, P4 family [Pontibaca salina]|uniref:Primase C-terminal domain-containing protein n=1 Tax=Pontibaca salina TaxID=2795731 RepID=A0A934HTR1_9RHOB|nr:phage/plasmid primase, P4 family [Pontibaca salina]MBI6630360.1 primase C-terminal domain-containing protein [Pontibaca salina]
MLNPIPSVPTELIEKLKSKKPVAANRTAPPSKALSVGSRNNSLASMAGFLRAHHGCDADQIYSALSALNATAYEPLPDDEVWGIARSISNYETGTKIEYDDVPLSKMAALKIAGTSCQTSTTGWLRFDGARWMDDPKGGYAKEQTKCFLEELAGAAKSTGDIDAMKNAKQLLSAPKVNRVFDLLSTDPNVMRSFDDFDRSVGELNLLNGTLNLSDFSLRPHSASDNITKLAGVAYEPDATCPVFDTFLSSTLSQEVQQFVLRLFGYSLLGNPKEQVFAIFHGPGRNGKSTLIDIVAHVLGDYACNAEPSTFIRQKNAGIRNDLARLKGARMVATSELATGEILDTALVKRINGGDIISARALYKEHFEFKPECVMFMTTNALPVIDGGDQALGRRLILMHFDRVVAEDSCDRDLPAKLRAEGSGILNRLLEGLGDYQKNGLNVPESIKREAARYMASSDMIQTFLKDECVLDPEGSIGAKSLYRKYHRWSQSNGIKAISQPIFRSEIVKRTGIKQKRTSKGLIWPGIRGCDSSSSFSV